MAKHRSNKKDQKHGRSKVQSKVVKPQQKQKKRVGGSAQVQQQHSILPYGKNDRILLVGEGVRALAMCQSAVEVESY